MVELRSSKLMLRTLESNDASSLANFEKRNCEHFAKYTPVSKTPWSKLLLKYLQEYKDGKSFRFVLFDRHKIKGPIMGVCNFTNIIRGPFQACYLGYKIDHAYEGKGLMFEALQQAISYMFKKQNLHRIMANYIPSNLRSEKLLMRLRFQKDGYAKEYLLIKEKWEGHILMSLTNSNWKGV